MNDLIILTNPHSLNQTDIEKVYDVFKDNFIDNNIYLTKNGTSYVLNVDKDNTCTCHFSSSDKQKTFWHIVTKKINGKKPKNNPCLDDSERNRTYCSYRAKRMKWIKYTIENWEDSSIVDHYYEEGANKLILWLKYKDFLVILKKVRGTTDKYLVSSYIIYKQELNNFRRKLKKYNEKKPILGEWF